MMTKNEKNINKVMDVLNKSDMPAIRIAAPASSKQNEVQHMLTEEKMRDMFGAHYDSVMYYNFDFNKWNRDTYMGYSVNAEPVWQAAATWFKSAVEAIPMFNAYEVVALVIMAAKYNLKTKAALIKNPAGAEDSTNMLGNVIFRNRKTKKVLPVSDLWLRLEEFDTKEAAVRVTPYLFFANAGFAKNSHLLRKMYGRQK